MTLNIFALGKQIKIVRRKKALSQNTLSEMIDKSPTYLSYIETGAKQVSLETFVGIVNALQCSADELLKDSIENTSFVTNIGFTTVLEDCSPFEQRFLYDLIVSAKQILRGNMRFCTERSWKF